MDNSYRHPLEMFMYLMIMRSCVHAGSVYCDVDLKVAGFHGESIRSGHVLVVKMHQPRCHWIDVNQPALHHLVYETHL